MSLARFSNRHVHRGRRLHWNRADIDGLPFRGAAAPMYTEEEHDERVKRVGDPFVETFDLRDANEKAYYLYVVEGVVNGHFMCIHIDRWRTPENRHGFVYVEWVEYFLEDGGPTSFLMPGLTEQAHAPLQLGNTPQ